MKILMVAVLVVVLTAAGFLWVNRPQFLTITTALSPDFPQGGFSHAGLEHLLQQYVDADGRVDYAAWHSANDARNELQHYLAAVSAFSPDNAPERFDSQDDELVYWIQAYNAYVIYSVLEHWPIASVTDVKAPIEAVRGMGFFYRIRYSFGGEFYSLLQVENGVIRKRFRDARIHFVLNCASDSCPVLRPELPTGDELESLLSRAAADYVGDPANVFIDHKQRRVLLSSIFKWFRKDFINDLRRRGLSTDRGLLDYVFSVAPSKLRRELAQTDGYEIAFFEYDWSLNSQHELDVESR